MTRLLNSGSTDPSATSLDTHVTLGPMARESVCFIGDSHGNEPWVHFVVQFAAEEGVRRFVQVGDFGFWPGPEGKAFLQNVSAHLVGLNAGMTVIEGNHDWHEWLATLVPESDGLVTIAPHLRWAPRGTVFPLPGADRCLAVGGAPSIDQDSRIEGVDWWRGETLTAAEVEQCLAAGPVDVVVAHDCPVEIPVSGLLGWPPGEAHRRIMSAIWTSARPRWWFSGHYHQRVSARLANPDGSSTRFEVLDCDESEDTGRGWIIVEAADLSEAGSA
jgi:hypothetical protein